MKTHTCRTILVLALLAGAIHASAVPGDLDTSFDGDGKLTTQVSTNAFGSDLARAVLVQSDGKIIAVGDSDSRIALVRYRTNGVPDPAFGTAGVVTTMLTVNDYFYVSRAALQSDGKIVVVGQVTIATNTTLGDVFVARYLTNGVLDSTFGTAGIAYRDLGYDDIGQAVAIQSDGRIVVAAYGYDFNLSVAHFGALRLLTNGAPDATFDGDGLAEVNFSGNAYQLPTAVALQSDSKIVLAGYAMVNDTNRLALARFNANGTLDPAFGTNGLALTSLGTTHATAAGVALQTDSKIVVAGDAYRDFDNYLLAARYTTNGTLDATFDADGVVLVPGAGGSALAVQTNGSILVAGYVTNDFGLFRFTAAGSLDSSFGSAGQVQTPFSVGSDSASALALQSDGKIVLAGSAFINFAFVFAVARYQGDNSASPGPALTIVRTAPGQATISWAPPTPGFVLQESLSLSPPNWTNAPSGATNPVTVPAALPAKVYRLFKL